MSEIWFAVIGLRVIWTFIGQTGYIHPDEFFQSTEVLAGDIFSFDVYRPWEFNATLPIRSIVLPYTIYGPPLYLLKALNHVSPFIDHPLITTYSLLLLPRLVVMAISIATDILIFKMARKLEVNPRPCQLVYITSYLTLVFYTRTLSNTLESFLFIALLYFVIQSYTNSKEQSKKVKKRDKDKKLKFDSKKGHQAHYAFQIALIIVLGFFNRPTFLLFAFVPYLYWILLGCMENKPLQAVQIILKKALLCGLYGIVIAFLCILCDSLYFGAFWIEDLRSSPRSLMSVGGAGKFLAGLTVTPLNFIRYNMDSRNLAHHGIHPRTQHLLVNTHLNFNILAVFALVDLARSSMNHLSSFKLPTMSQVEKAFLLSSYFVPIILLSVFPHQEPRFLIPLLAPVVLLYSHQIFGSKSRAIYKTLWVTLNLLCCLFYGVVHQGGLVPCLSHLQTVKSQSNNTATHVVFYHTYMPPRHLLTVSAESETSDPLSKQIFKAHDLKGAPPSELYYKINDIFTVDPEAAIFVASPASLHQIFSQVSPQGSFQFQRQTSFWPHLSMEDQPNWAQVISNQNQAEAGNWTFIAKAWERLKKLLALDLYLVIK